MDAVTIRTADEMLKRAATARHFNALSTELQINIVWPILAKLDEAAAIGETYILYDLHQAYQNVKSKVTGGEFSSVVDTFSIALLKLGYSIRLPSYSSELDVNMFISFGKDGGDRNIQEYLNSLYYKANRAIYRTDRDDPVIRKIIQTLYIQASYGNFNYTLTKQTAEKFGVDVSDPNWTYLVQLKLIKATVASAKAIDDEKIQLSWGPGYMNK
jgi:hypothetical protein